MTASETTQFIAALRESAATVHSVAQALRGALQAARQARRDGSAAAVPPKPSAAAPSRAAFRSAAECPDGSCSPGAAARTNSAALPGLNASAITAALSGDSTRMLQGVLRGVVGQLSRGAGAGGGLGASLLSGLVGGGLSLLLGRLFDGFGRAAAPAAGPLPLPALLHFPQLAEPGYASAPASALFGQRAVPRGPGFSVTVEYRRGADDFVVAKVAQRLSELNDAEGVH